MESSSLSFLGVAPCADGELSHEDLTGLGEEDGSLRADHLERIEERTTPYAGPDGLVGLHDLLDSGHGELDVVLVDGLGVGLVDFLLDLVPEGGELLLLIVHLVGELHGVARGDLGSEGIRDGLRTKETSPESGNERGGIAGNYIHCCRGTGERSGRCSGSPGTLAAEQRQD